MQAICFDKPFSVSLQDLPMPQIKPDEVLIRVEAAGICGTDVHLFQGHYDPKYPLVPGHEFAGVVTAVGGDVTGLAAGDRVTVDPNLYCDNCYYCRQNMQNHCERWAALGVTLPGGFAEFVAAPQSSVYSINKLSFVEGALIEPLSCVVYGQERARLHIGDTVLIFGAGPIGLMHLQLAKRSGASHVTVVDLRDDRLVTARQMGANFTVSGANGSNTGDLLREISPYGYDLVIDATGVPAVVEKALAYVKIGGRLLLFGVCPNESQIKLNPYDVYRRDLHIIGAFASRKSFLAARNLLEAGAIDANSLIGLHANLTDFPQALDMMRQGVAPMKILVDPQNRQHRLEH